jgi:O-antigen/teichoic acid export membrane protein
MVDRKVTRFKRLAKEGSWIVVGQVAAVAGALALVRLLTEHLDPAQFGQLSLGLTVAGLVNQTVLGGISAGISRLYAVAVEKHHLHAYLRDSVRLLGYATLVVAALSIALMAALLWLGNSHWMGLAAAALAFSVLSGFNGALSGIQNAARQRAIVAIHGGLDAWLKILHALGVMLWLGSTGTAVVIGYCCSSLLVTASQLFFLRRTIPTEGSSVPQRNLFLRQMWAFSWPFSAWGIFSWMQQASDRWALAAFATPDSVGLYAVLSQLGYGPVAMLTAMVMTFLAPILYQRSGDATDQARNARVHRLVWAMTFASLTVTLAGVVVAVLAHDWLFRLLVAAEYRHASYLLPWAVLAGGIFAAGQVLALKLMSEMKSSRMATAKIVTALLGVGFNVYGATVAGLPGVVAALVAFSVVYLAWMVVLANGAPNPH